MLRPLPRASAPPERDPLVTRSARGFARHGVGVFFPNPHNPHTPTPASIDAPPAATGDDSLHTRRIMVRWKDASVLHLFSDIEAP